MQIFAVEPQQGGGRNIAGFAPILRARVLSHASIMVFLTLHSVLKRFETDNTC